MSAPMKRVVPWVNWTEWTNVYEELFSENTKRQRHGLSRIAVWRCRVPYRLATAIDCTSQLVCAQLQEARARVEGALRSRDQELCMGYAMVLVRFVNLLTEKRQTKFYPLPLHVIAEELGLPNWLVELRHDITHSSLPSLSVMREATHQALQWLKQEYWMVQLKDLENDMTSSTGEFTKDSVVELLAEFVKHQIEMVSIKSNSGTAGELEKQVEEIVQKLKTFLPSSRDVMLDQTVHHMTNGGQLLETLKINFNVLVEYEELTLPHRLVNVWQPLLQLFHQSHATPLLLQKLMQLQSEIGGLQDRLLAGWVVAVVTAIHEGSRGGSPLRNVYEGMCDVNASLLLRLSLRNPNRFTLRLLTRLFTVSGNDVSPTQRHQLVKLVSLYIQANSSDNDISLDDTDRVLAALHQHGQSSSGVDEVAKRDRNEQKTNGTSQLDTRWQQGTDAIDWSLYGFGDGPGCTPDYTNLELDESVDIIHQSLHTDHSDDAGSEDRCDRDSDVSMDNQCDMEVDTDDDCDIRASEEVDFWTPKELYDLRQTVMLFKCPH